MGSFTELQPPDYLKSHGAQKIFDTKLKTIRSTQFQLVSTEIFRLLEKAQPHCAPSPTICTLSQLSSLSNYVLFHCKRLSRIDHFAGCCPQQCIILL
jgi:hypothetical protein